MFVIPIAVVALLATVAILHEDNEFVEVAPPAAVTGEPPPGWCQNRDPFGMNAADKAACNL